MSESVLYRFTAYLMKAIKNERIRYCDKLKTMANSEVILDEEMLDISAYEQKYFQRLDQAEFLFEDEKLASVIANLSSKDKDILRWKFILGLRHKDMAVRLGISKAAMDKQYQRLLERIRKELMK